MVFSVLLTVTLLAQVHSATVQQPPHIRHLRMLAQVHRVWDPNTGKQMGVVPFALANDFTPGIRDSAKFEVDLRGADRGNADMADALTHSAAMLFPAAPRMSGAFYIPLPGKPSKWRVTAHEPEGRAEKHIELAVTPLVEGPFALSDVVIGSAQQGVSWTPGSVPISLAPKQIVFSDRWVQLNYQVRSESARTGLRTRLIITRIIDETAQDGEVITLGFPGERVAAGLNLVQREIDASRLSGSRYRIDVEVLDKAGLSLGMTSGMIELVR